MKLRNINISKNKSIVIIIGAFIIFSAPVISRIYNQNIANSNTETSADVLVSLESLKLLPRIRIPKIGVDAFVEEVGIDQEGFIGSPLGPDNTAWFKESVVPGVVGIAIIDGHSGWKNNIPAVFDNLQDLEVGDKIYVEYEVGVVNVFVVTKLKTYEKNDEALEVFNSDDNKVHLNIITCIGSWNEEDKDREKRIVVFTDLVVEK